MPFQLQREEIRRKRGKPLGDLWRRRVGKLTFYARGLWFSRGLPTNQSSSRAFFLLPGYPFRTGELLGNGQVNIRYVRLAVFPGAVVVPRIRHLINCIPLFRKPTFTSFNHSKIYYDGLKYRCFFVG